MKNTDHVEVLHSDSLNVGNSITIEAWIKVDELSQHEQFIVNKYNYGAGKGYCLATLDEKIKRNSVAIRSMNAPGGTTIGTWHYVVGTYDGTSMSVYIDGKLVNSQSNIFTIQNYLGELRIGTASDQLPGPGYAFDGIIDEVNMEFGH